MKAKLSNLIQITGLHQRKEPPITSVYLHYLNPTFINHKKRPFPCLLRTLMAYGLMNKCLYGAIGTIDYMQADLLFSICLPEPALFPIVLL